MPVTFRRFAVLSAGLSLLVLAACSSSFGTDSAPPQHTTVVVPNQQ